MGHKEGYIALTTILIIGAILLAIGLVLGLTSVTELQISLSNFKKNEALNAVESCAEEALTFYRNTDSVPSVITLPETTCNVTINTQTSNNIVFVINVSESGYAKSLEIDASKTDHVYVNSWREIE